LDTDWL